VFILLVLSNIVSISAFKSGEIYVIIISKTFNWKQLKL
jgi:hypothetical protein